MLALPTSYLVYKATSPSEKVYIGMTKKNLDSRRKEHEWHSKSNKVRKIFHSALRKYELNFTWEVLIGGLTKEEAEKKEIEYIAQLNATDRDFGYNQAKGGMAGNIMTPESRAKWKEKMQALWDNPKYSKRLSDSQKRMHTEDHNWKEKQSIRMKETFNNPERKAKNTKMLQELNGSRKKREFMATVKGGKPFICVETNERFELLQDAADRFGVDKRRIHCILKYPQRYKTLSKLYTFRYVEQEKV